MLESQPKSRITDRHEWCRIAIVEGLDQPRMVAIYMPDICKVFAILHMICISIWIHHHTASVIFVGVHSGKSAEI